MHHISILRSVAIAGTAVCRLRPVVEAEGSLLLVHVLSILLTLLVGVRASVEDADDFGELERHLSEDGEGSAELDGLQGGHHVSDGFLAGDIVGGVTLVPGSGEEVEGQTEW